MPIPSVYAALRFFILSFAVLLFAAQPAVAAEFDPNLIISDSQFRDVNSMNEADIQAFLEKQPGVLSKLVTPNHNGVPQRVSKIIYDSCQEFGISPKVMLTMLQKEQSLLTRTVVDKRTLERAIGAGCPNGVDNRYPGFGNQIWNGARMLDGYGEGKTTTYVKIWKPGMTYSVAEGSVTPRNIATYKLFVYNPVIGARQPYGDLSSQSSLSGNANFWRIYRKNFGEPEAATTGAVSPRTVTAQPAPPVSNAQTVDVPVTDYTYDAPPLEIDEPTPEEQLAALQKRASMRRLFGTGNPFAVLHYRGAKSTAAQGAE